MYIVLVEFMDDQIKDYELFNESQDSKIGIKLEPYLVQIYFKIIKSSQSTVKEQIQVHMDYNACSIIIIFLQVMSIWDETNLD